MIRILTEASGSLVAGFLIKAIQEAGCQAIASDIDPECVGKYLADDFALMPPSADYQLWDYIDKVVDEKKIDMVIPSLDETLSDWSKRKELFEAKGVLVLLSDVKTIEICQDKWQTYQFFKEAGIPTPATSLQQDYLLVKPRFGRGGRDICITQKSVEMNDMISQELLQGKEYTVDVFCDKKGNPIYIVPRLRGAVREGKSTAGTVVCHPEIESWVRKICSSLCFIGPVNMQCFECKETQKIHFTEINPRIAGGMALGFAATENWINLAVDHFLHGKEIKSQKIHYGLRMKRYYAEVFVS